MNCRLFVFGLVFFAFSVGGVLAPRALATSEGTSNDAVGGAVAADDTSAVRTIWRLLDYIAVDYPGAVEDGRIVSDLEYTEMVEFAASVQSRLGSLPPAKALPGLIRGTVKLQEAISKKRDADEVAAVARQLADDLLVAFPVVFAPTSPPDLTRGAELYAGQCVACHGATGRGDGPAAAGLEPAPTDFTDQMRARERSLFGLYQVIDQGLDGTAMASFSDLDADDRWALAFYAGGMAYSEAEAGAGAELWQSDPDIGTAIPDLEALTRSRPSALAARLGEEAAVAVTAFLRQHPDAATARRKSGSLALAQTRLAESLAAYRSGNLDLATDLALSAYLDGFEPVEPAVAVRDGQLMLDIETAMIELRAAIKRNAPIDDVEVRIGEVSRLLSAAEAVLLSGQSDATSSFIGAFTVLLREGLEALLIVVAMIAFLNKADRRDVLPFVHGGWLVALVAGVLTWFVASRFISISGASRELTEGIGALLAAVVLVSVGIWMHGKSHADTWQRYITKKMTSALSRKSEWFLFTLAFVVVYREVFETILFFMAMWGRGDRMAILAGGGTATAALALISWAMLSYSRRLPITQFFLYSSLLIAVLAVVLAGKGIAAIQEAGWLDVRPIAGGPRLELLGLFPTWEGLGAQTLTLVILIVAFWINNRSAEKLSA